MSSSRSRFDPICTGRTGTPGVPEDRRRAAANGTTYAWRPPLVPWPGCTSYCGEGIDARGAATSITCDDAHPIRRRRSSTRNRPIRRAQLHAQDRDNTARLTLDPVFAGLPLPLGVDLGGLGGDRRAADVLVRNVTLTTTRATELTVSGVGPHPLGDATVEIEFTDPNVDDAA